MTRSGVPRTLYWALPVAVIYTKDLRELHRYIEYPAIYNKDRVRGSMQAARPGEDAAQRKERDAREFAALQASPFFDLWASAAIAATCTAFYMTRLVAMTFWGRERFLERPAGGEADDLAARGVATGAELWSHGLYDEAVWQWRFSFESHWGRARHRRRPSPPARTAGPGSRR